MTASLAADASPRSRASSDAIAIGSWLSAAAFMVFAMAVIGAVTRLTGSGLSMVEWRPLIDWVPPLNEAQWMRVFDLYRATPEYLHINRGMDLEEFKAIFFWEWIHRLWGHLIGLVFAVPLLWFWISGRLNRVTHVPRLKAKLLGLLALGGLQGVVGWLMVESGLVDRPSVSHYRLAIHLGMAVLVFGLLVWMAMRVLKPTAEAQPAPLAGVRRHGWGALGLLALTIIWGAFVAGLNAGLMYNTFPSMNGAFIPSEAWGYEPLWINAFENRAMIQFIHRALAILTCLAALALTARALAAGATGIARRAAIAVGAMALIQVGLGIATLLLMVPITLGALHQAGALTLLALLLWFQYESRSAGQSQASAA